MQIGIPIFDGRVAPRCTIADTIMLIRANQEKILSISYINREESNWAAMLKKLIDKRIDTIVCGGINKEDKKMAESKGVNIIDNVACNEDELIEAIKNNKLRPGYGFIPISDDIILNEPIIGSNEINDDFNCLRCHSMECEEGCPCPLLTSIDLPAETDGQLQMLNTANDIILEDERKLCRLSELIYYALEMKYGKIGIAYCTDLKEPTEILVSVLRRFFEVNPVCCKVSWNGSNSESERSERKLSCNPMGQAKILNKLGVDLNIMVGLCIGADSIFTELSDAPVTTLFVKDKSLANNPIGALYSEYYLNEFEKNVLE